MCASVNVKEPLAKYGGAAETQCSASPSFALAPSKALATSSNGLWRFPRQGMCAGGVHHEAPDKHSSVVQGCFYYSRRQWLEEANVFFFISTHFPLPIRNHCDVSVCTVTSHWCVAKFGSQMILSGYRPGTSPNSASEHARVLQDWIS